MHGKTSMIHHDGRTVFTGLPNPFEATRYHSLIVNRRTLPNDFEVSAETLEGEIMGLRHKPTGAEGVQFHPESILTKEGMTLLKNFLHQLSPVFATFLPFIEQEGMSDSIIKEAIMKLSDGTSLSEKEAEEVMLTIMQGNTTDAQIAAYLMGLRMKGETIEEISGSAKAMRRMAKQIHVSHPMLIDTCGTGGDQAQTFNISTAAAFVVAGGDLTVAKHGNRSVSSKSGSADVLTALGIEINLAPEQVEDCINEVGIGFLFAPRYHEAMKYCAKPRADMGIRTLMNILGPLSNPAGATIQVLGVYEKALTEKTRPSSRPARYSTLLCHSWSRWLG